MAVPFGYGNMLWMTPAGFEPAIQDWKPCVLTAWLWRRIGKTGFEPVQPVATKKASGVRPDAALQLCRFPVSERRGIWTLKARRQRIYSPPQIAVSAVLPNKKTGLTLLHQSGKCAFHHERCLSQGIFIGYSSYIRTQQKKRSLYQFHGYGNSVQYNNKSYAVSWSLHPFISYCISFLNALSEYHIIYEMSTGLFHWGQNLYQGTNLSPFCPLSGNLSPVSKTGDKNP